ncbi:hypothetical protein [Vibrio cortegadensis]|uniref:Uncharacterized protein n=1 Tax=Vibrio cortegadensis TaxID=1328770 RepID=A0ABV4MBS1_9VIBR
MKKIQCTFRLPQHVVDLIDQQDGDTRTDKLLYLLGVDAKEATVMHDVVNIALHERLCKIEDRIYSLENKPSSKNKNMANLKRKQQTIDLINKELKALSAEQIKNIKSSRYPLSETRKVTNISKSQCDSYTDMIRDFLEKK